MATGYPSNVSALAALYQKAQLGMAAAIRLADEREACDAAEAVQEAAAPQPPIEWTKYPPPRDPFADKDKR